MQEPQQYQHDASPMILGLHPFLQECEIARALVSHRAQIVDHADAWRIVFYRTCYILQKQQAGSWRSQRALHEGFPHRPDGLPVSGIVLYATAAAAKQAVKTREHMREKWW